jgi:uncharacterized protein (DUF58 family)
MQQQLTAWMRRRIKPAEEITLNRRNIYVLPTRNGLLFILSAALIFIAAINYAVSLAFGLAFMMVSLFVLSILYTFNNLNQVTLRRLPVRPVYSGESIAYNVELSRSPSRRHESLELCFDRGVVTPGDLLDVDRVQLQVFTPATQRGYLSAPLLRISTCFPLGLCRAWSVVDLDMHCLVYPKPIAFVMNQFNAGGGGSEDSALLRDGSEEFYGLRDYVPGDPLRQVAWKNIARGQGMHVKQFVDYVDSRVWLDWDMFFGFDVEGRLSRLCYCVLQLSRQQAAFGMKLPGVEIKPATGIEHRDALLRELAFFQIERRGLAGSE